jgi:hypothetical protein
VLGQVEPTLGTLTLTHPAGPGVPAGTITGQRANSSGALSLSGTVSRAGTNTPWTATKDPLVGDWIGSAPMPRLRIMHPPTDLTSWTGAWLPDALPQGWQSLSVTVNGALVTLEASGFRFTGTFSGPTLEGQVTIATFPSTTTRPWSARRVDDGLLL